MVRKSRKNRLARKFLTGVAAILILTLASSLFVNSKVAERYYLYRQRAAVAQTGARLEAEIKAGTAPEEAVKQIEDSENVLIVSSDRVQEPDALSEELREAFRRKGLGFQKFWLWEGDYSDTMKNGSKFRLYQQDRLNYGILTEYLSIDGRFYAIAAIVPNAGQFVKIINRFGIALYSISLFAAIILIGILINRITKPLNEIEAFTKKLSTHTFEPLHITTGDELEDVADSLNRMGHEIKQYQSMLQDKNRQMEQLFNDVAHDLKTPVSLIAMYASGMKDGLDDGSFLNTIEKQNEKISRILEQLLNLSRIEQKDHPLTEVNVSKLLAQCIGEQRIFLQNRSLELAEQIEADIMIQGSPQLMGEMFSNLLSNAMKYASSGTIELSLSRQKNQAVFRISNEFDNADLDLSRIWQPFYVGESSRSKALSGTGLGLSIVKKIVEQTGGTATCHTEGSRICFEVILPL